MNEPANRGSLGAAVPHPGEAVRNELKDSPDDPVFAVLGGDASLVEGQAARKISLHRRRRYS